MFAFTPRLALVAACIVPLAAAPAFAQTTGTSGSAGTNNGAPASACSHGQNGAGTGATGTSGQAAGTINEVASKNGGRTVAGTGTGTNPAGCR
jgi:hypothetical protein